VETVHDYRMCCLAAMRQNRMTSCWRRQGKDAGDWRASRHCDGWDADASALWTRMELHPAELRDCAALRLPGGDAGWRNGVAKSVATTNLINALAEYHKVRFMRRRWVQVHRRTDQRRQDCHRRRGVAGLTIAACAGEGWVLAGLLVAEMWPRAARAWAHK